MQHHASLYPVIRLANDADEKAWNDYVYANPLSKPYHDYRWRSVIRDTFKHEPFYLISYSGDGKINGVLPLVRLKSYLFGDYMVSVPYFNYGGILADSSELARNLYEYVSIIGARTGVSHIELRQHEMVEIEAPLRTDKVTMLLRLPPDPEELWAELGAKRRSQIKRPLRENISVLTGGLDLLDAYYAVFSRNMRDLGTPVYSKEFFRNILNTFSESTTIFVILFNNKPVAAAFLIGYKKTLEIPWASSLREANPIGINMLLYWEVLKYAIAGGYNCFDFGRCSRNSNTYKFKKQWGAVEHPLYWYYWLNGKDNIPMLNPNNPKYRLFISIWKKLPLTLTKIIGPHIVKNLP